MAAPAASAEEVRPRARDLGIVIGTLPPGPLNAITDVAGVAVGQVTLIEGSDVRTGVTAILPHGGNLFEEKVPAGFVRGNGFGKFAGSTQVEELGELETPIVLTNTLSVAEGIAGAIEWTLAQPGNGEARSVNAVVGETNDGWLNAIRKRRVTVADVRRAIEAAQGGPVAEGAVGAGTGTIAFGWKGGIGTASRVLAARDGGFTVGVLVQSNFGGELTIAGVAAGRALESERRAAGGDGSIVIVVATDAPLSDRNLGRLALRALLGMARTGGNMSNGSGDYVLAFSTAKGVRRTPERRARTSGIEELPNDRTSPLFVAVAEATEEAILNSMLSATTTSGNGITVKALPAERVRALVRDARVSSAPPSR